MKKFLFWVLQFTWCLLQNIIGGIMYIILRCNPNNKHFKFYEACAVEFPNRRGSVSIGAFLMLHPNATYKTTQHEYGHCIQSMLLGPLYIFVIGIPSLVWASKIGDWYRCKCNKTYYSFYTESWADKLGGVER